MKTMPKTKVNFQGAAAQGTKRKGKATPATTSQVTGAKLGGVPGVSGHATSGYYFRTFKLKLSADEPSVFVTLTAPATLYPALATMSQAGHLALFITYFISSKSHNDA